MMFMMPTPPTTSEISATTSSRVLISPMVEAHRLGDFGHVADVEIVGSVRRDAVPLAQQVGDLARWPAGSRRRRRPWPGSGRR